MTAAMVHLQGAASPALLPLLDAPQMDHELAQPRWLQAQQGDLASHPLQQHIPLQQQSPSCMPQQMQMQHPQQLQHVRECPSYDMQQQRLQMLLQQHHGQQPGRASLGYGDHLSMQHPGLHAAGGALQQLGRGASGSAPLQSQSFGDTDEAVQLQTGAHGGAPQQLQPFGNLEGALQLQREQLARQQRLDQMQVRVACDADFRLLTEARYYNWHDMFLYAMRSV